MTTLLYIIIYFRLLDLVDVFRYFDISDHQDISKAHGGKMEIPCLILEKMMSWSGDTESLQDFRSWTLSRTIEFDGYSRNGIDVKSFSNTISSFDA